MYAIRFLNGIHRGRIFNLQEGQQILGRAEHCQIAIPAPGISKEHLEIRIHLKDQEIRIRDLHSSNGTFLNSVRISTAPTKVKCGDRISISGQTFEFIKLSLPAAPLNSSAVAGSGAIFNPVGSVPAHSGESLMSHLDFPGGPPLGSSVDLNGFPGTFGSGEKNLVGANSSFRRWLDQVVLSGFFDWVKVVEFKTIFLFLIGFFVIIFTFLTIVPIKEITTESVVRESEKRAVTVARALAQVNAKVIQNGDLSQLNTNLVMREDGIEDVYIFSSSDGTFLAPSDRMGGHPRDVSFTKKAIQMNRELAEPLDEQRVGAAVPILSYDPELQQNVARAFVVVVYNTNGMAFFDEGKTFNLFVKMLFVAAALGFLLYFFLYRLGEYPVVQLNQLLDQALRDREDHLVFDIKMSSIQSLVSNINALLMRNAQSGFDGDHSPQMAGAGSRDPEMFNLVTLMSGPCLLINRENIVLKINTAFENLTLLTEDLLRGRSIQYIPDQALQQNISSLIQESQKRPQDITIDHLDMGGIMQTLRCQAISSFTGEPDYYLVTMSALDQGQGGH